ncbi:hypothetical protein BD0027_13440 [Helicobacter pylori]|uniref:hypothetical protein n=1 Tax=Helicobacter pylori TaxID=210 RepID=UPI0036F330A8
MKPQDIEVVQSVLEITGPISPIEVYDKAKELFEIGEALFKFDGAVICISHDRELIDAYANRIIELVPSPKGASIIDFKGSYEEYLASKK